MSTLEIAKKYVDLVKSNNHEEILTKLFSKDIVNVEAGAPAGHNETKGIENVIAAGKKWQSEHEIHSAKVEGPWPLGNRFVVRFTYDVTNKPSGKRLTFDEAALFTVENDKIVREEFFYAMG